MRKLAVTLLSGGLDSATALAIARSQGFENHALTFEYGQRHLIEIEAARRVARSLAAATHRIVKIDSRILAGSALTSPVAVPKSRTLDEIAEGIPITYVAARNAIFLAHALGYAETLGASDIFIGVNALDYSGYPDCRPEFIRAFETMANLGTKAGIEGQKYAIHTPLIELTKAQIIRQGAELGVDFSVTHSCYDPPPDGRACGQCDSCQLRRKGFHEAGVVDPIRYAA